LPAGLKLTSASLEEVSGMFATLNIVLGSDYEGGEVYVKEGDMTHTFEVLKSSEFSSHYISWHASL
jgi:hypothetical protein